MSELPFQNPTFRVDTHRPRSRSKLRSKIRHVLAVAAGMFPLMAIFVFVMSFFQIAEQRKGLHMLAVGFLACGMIALVFYAWARSEKLRRYEISSRNREMRHRRAAPAPRPVRPQRTSARRHSAGPAAGED